MRTPVIGGTVFLGRAVVEAALARGDDVRYFHRGRHGRGPHAGARELLGDRADGVPDGEFDAVMDTCGFDPDTVGASARSLEPEYGPRKAAAERAAEAAMPGRCGPS